MSYLQDENGLLAPEERAVVLAAVEATFAQQGCRGHVDISILNEADMQCENHAQRGVDAVTDVLSFPTVQPGEVPPDAFWGDILICPARAAAQAREYGHSMARELAFLAVHGMLHLFGYDHGTTEEESGMIAAQERILERMGLSR